MPPDPVIDDEEYESSQDSDFAPDDDAAAAGVDSEAEDSDSEAHAEAASSKRKRDATAEEADDAGFENSGDEALIKKAKKKRKKTKGGDGEAAADDDEGGEGGLVKTRSMRAAEKEERKVAAASGPVTVDVDAIWAQMLAGQTPKPQQTADAPAETAAAPAHMQPAPTSRETESPDVIRIKRTYNFAGKVQTEEKLVARESAEAKLYLASLGKNGAAPPADAAADGPDEPKRALRRAFRSAYEPAFEIVGPRSDLNLGVTMRIKARESKEAKKLNTVQKSKMDWAGYVDQEGLKDELELAGRSKESYAGRQDFLARSEAKREEEARRARMAGRVG
ncbi:SWR1-complex protein 5 [Colletotrichum orbiculare MAFF 240422]|uniref:SWR1-complex protein 5 n=1 Tax=Colletotrichum orbiculare (strain 104-T / ATCC 96160 / CBS 514.97 / LARS 414 / MAFF 240422) TaxID=1213857 RepID=N4VD25_COLOR|nr:SWR1-complex protein 5 [Colletotrichum orbiculare MAFF 240422]